MNPKIKKIMSMKGNEKISMLTAYDYHIASIEDAAGIEIVLVGDSLSMVVLGFETTQKATMQHMLHHTAAVARAVNKALVVRDMPYKSYETKDCVEKRTPVSQSWR